MGIYTYVERLERLDQLIRLAATGTPRELAEKMDISLRSVHDYIEALRALGAPVVYSREDTSYIYQEKGVFKIGFESMAAVPA